MTQTGPPPKKKPGVALPPDVAKEIARLDGRFKGMWEKYIEPMSKQLAEMAEQGVDAGAVEQIADLSARLDATRQTLVASLYDPMALKLLDAEIRAAQDIIRSTPEKARDIWAELQRSKAHERQRGLEQRAEDIKRPQRIAIRLLTHENDDGKTKNTYPNEDARADKLADVLAEHEDYQAVMAALDEVLLEKALAKGAMDDLERERKAASQLLRSYESQLNNLTARLINPTPMNIGGSND